MLIASSKTTAIIGTGLTGRSVARFLQREGRPFVWLDSRDNPPGIEQLKIEYPKVHFELGDFSVDTLISAGELVVSPGVALSHPAIVAAQEKGATITCDIELFLDQIVAPVVAITGSNAKSTVTTLVGEMAEASGLRVAVGGNLGIPVLDMLDQTVDLYVLELSSFQLEMIGKLNALAATILNLSADHMDRYASMAEYHAAKQRVYFGAQNVVLNRADPLTRPPIAEHMKLYSFGLDAPDRGGFGIAVRNGKETLAHEFQSLMPVSDVRMPGRHNLENALAALALGTAAGFELSAMLGVLRDFPGLPHRCQWVGQFDGVDYYNDSKGTNVGATMAALKGFNDRQGRVVLIAGGEGKGADFSPLASSLRTLRGLVTLGVDGDQIASLAPEVTQTKAVSMSEAVAKAKALASPGDLVLLSPACASFDMFKSYEDRGEQFVAAVDQLNGGQS